MYSSRAEKIDVYNAVGSSIHSFASIRGSDGSPKLSSKTGDREVLSESGSFNSGQVAHTFKNPFAQGALLGRNDAIRFKVERRDQQADRVKTKIDAQQMH